MTEALHNGTTTTTTSQLEPLLVGYDAAAVLLGISRRTLESLVLGHRVPFLKIGGRVLFHPPALRRWIEEQIRDGGTV